MRKIVLFFALICIFNRQPSLIVGRKKLQAEILPDSARPGSKTKTSPRRMRFLVLSHFPDSNRGPTHYECVALPTEPKWPTFQKRVQRYNKNLIYANIS